MRGDQSCSSATFVNRRQASPLIETTLVSPSSSRGSNPMTRGNNIWSSAPFLSKDYRSPLYHPETGKSDDIQDEDGHPLLIILKIFENLPLSSRDGQVRWRAKTLFCLPETIKFDRMRTRHGYPILSLSRHWGFCSCPWCYFLLFLIDRFRWLSYWSVEWRFNSNEIRVLSLLLFYLQQKISKEGQLSYPNFVRGHLLLVYEPWLITLGHLNKHRRVIRKVLRRFRKKSAKNTKIGVCLAKWGCK